VRIEVTGLRKNIFHLHKWYLSGRGPQVLSQGISKMFKSHWLSKNFLAIGAAVLALSGCGGSSSSSSPPPPPPPPPPANVAPTADAGPDQTVDELAEVTLDGTGSTDSDGTVSSYTWVQTAGTVVTLDETSPANPTFTAPDLAANETLTFQLTVTDDDGDDSAPDTVDINVVANAAPVANAGPDQTVDELAVVTLDGSASTDPDGTIASYTWTKPRPRRRRSPRRTWMPTRP
jgi:hypothetical protein